jgi:hypothetical protein
MLFLLSLYAVAGGLPFFLQRSQMSSNQLNTASVGERANDDAGACMAQFVTQCDRVAQLFSGWCQVGRGMTGEHGKEWDEGREHPKPQTFPSLIQSHASYFSHASTENCEMQKI